ncbi:MAG: BON domain-containing protein [Planctomycetaceae bacterium]
MAMPQAIQLERQVHNSVAENDISIRLRLAEALRNDGRFANQEVQCVHCEGVVVLRGRVQSFHEKQMAQELARKVAGVEVVVNRLVVDRSKFARDVTDEIPLKVGVQLSGGIS